MWRRASSLMPSGAATLRATTLAAVLLSAAPSAAQTAHESTTLAPTAFSEQAAQLGVSRCANLFAGIGRAATAGSTYAVQVQAHGDDPDAHTVQGVVGIAYDRPDTQGQAAAVVSAAPAGKGCEGQMVRVAPFQVTCPEVLGLLPEGSTAAGDLAGVPLHNLGGNQGQALLVPSGSACVVVSIARMVESP